MDLVEAYPFPSQELHNGRVVRVDDDSEPFAAIECHDCFIPDDFASKKQRWFWNSPIFCDFEAARAVERVIVDVIAKLPWKFK